MLFDRNLKASLIIPIFNEAACLPALLNCLHAQDCASSDWEAILVDDGSTDGSSAVLQNLPANFSLLQLPKNLGRAAARNRGAAQARGTIFIFLDADMQVATGFVSQHIRLHEGAGIAGAIGRVELAGDTEHDAFRRYLATGNRGVQHFRDSDWVPFEKFLFCNSSVSAKLFGQSEGFNEQLSGYGGEDLELAFRLQNMTNLPFLYSAKISTRHAADFSLESKLRQLREYGAGNLKRIAATQPELLRVVLHGFESGWRKHILRLFCWRCPTKFLLKNINRMPRFAADFAIRALMMCAIFQGWTNQENDNDPRNAVQA